MLGSKATPDMTSTCTLVRISDDISDGEKKSIAARKKVVTQWYARKGVTVDPDKVPVVGILLSGGGLTAMVGCMATLHELKNQDLLDAAVYTFGCSGSTWALTPLNEAGNWSENMDQLVSDISNRLAGVSWDIQKGLTQLIAASNHDDYSLTDIWAYVAVCSIVKHVNESTMSSWRATQESGAVPYSVHAMVDKTEIEKTDYKNPRTHFESTAHDSGYPVPGAFVDTAYLGTKFHNGNVVKREPEPTLAFMKGMWGSAFASLKGGFLDSIGRHLIDPHQHHFTPKSPADGGVFEVQGMIQCLDPLLEDLKCIYKGGGGADAEQKILGDLKKAISPTPDSVTSKVIHMMEKEWVSSSDSDKANMMKLLSSVKGLESNAQLPSALGNMMLKTAACLTTFEWGTTNNFTKGLNDFADPLKDCDKISLIDSGFGMNVPFPQALRPPRKVELMLAFSFSTSATFESLQKTVDYCAANSIPFPTATIPPVEESNPSKDCYIFEEHNKPTVMYFPLFNQVNAGGSVKEKNTTFSFLNYHYTKDEIDALMAAARTNVCNNAPIIQEEILKLVSK